MEAVRYAIVLFALGASAMVRAAEPTCVLSSLPPSVYLITEPREGGAPGSSSILEVSRNNKGMVALFSSRAVAEAFLNAMTEAQRGKRVASAFPKSFAREFQKHGASLILDPLTMGQGGTPIAADAEREPEAKDNPELTSICDEDQADRRCESGKSIDWKVVGPRDSKRLARVKELYRDGNVVTGPDYFRAALVLQHGAGPDNYLLAHEFAVVSIAKGDAGNAAWLAAASEDRFLLSIGRKQRFGTQLSDPIVVDGCITDRLREDLGIPSLVEEQEQAQRSNPRRLPNQSSQLTTPSVMPPAGSEARQP